MSIQFNKLKPGHGMVSMTFYESDYQDVFEQKIKHYAQNVRLKGFRLGTVPLHFVKSKHGLSILDEVLHKLAFDQLQNYLKEASIYIFMEPLLVDAPTPEHLQNNKEFTFSYELGVVEDDAVDLGPHISVNRFSIDRVDDSFIDEFIEGIQLIHGTFDDMETSTEKSVLLGSIEDIASQEAIELRIIIDRVPQSLRESLLGLRIGDTFSLTKEMLQDHSSAVLGIISGLFAYLNHRGNFPYTFTIRRIGSITPANLGTKLFDLVLGKDVVDSESGFKEALAKIVLFDKSNEANGLFHDALSDTLLSHFNVDLSETFIKNFLLSKNPNATPEAIDSYYEENQKKIRWEILLGKIMRQNDLVVTPSDMLHEAKNIYINYLREKLTEEEVANHGESNIMKAAVAFLQQNEGKNYIEIHQRLSKEKALEFIKKNISIHTQSITAQQFDDKQFV